MIFKNLGPSLLACFIVSSLLASECHEAQMVQRLDTYTRGRLDRGLIDGLKAQVIETPLQSLPLPNHGKFPLLFERHPALQTKIAHISFCDLPTPVIDCKLARNLGVRKLYIKNDGVTGKKGIRLSFGGNKPRKLEFLLADAVRYGCPGILTRAGTGTNFGLAAAIYAQELGLSATLILAHQPSSTTVRRNLLLMNEAKARLRVASNRAFLYALSATEFAKFKEDTGRFPYVIPTGGSHPIGVLGFVNAAFELREQISLGVLNEPDYIFAAAGNGTGGMPGNGVGSSGTMTGLILGGLLAGFEKATFVIVHVEPEEKEGELIIDIKHMFHATNALLHEADPSIPLFEFPKNVIEVKDYCGEDYGLFTKEGMAARQLLLDSDGIKLDGTYTGKAFAGMLATIEKRKLQDKTHLFWDGYCSSDFNQALANADYTKLPKVLHHYFEKPTQPLDKP